jgi:hypothetical protein
MTLCHVSAINTGRKARKKRTATASAVAVFLPRRTGAEQASITYFITNFGRAFLFLVGVAIR